ncbi:hypothetical protein [Streptantibioticus silvisoli]|uniref:Uncharacterized protein n=1 Tax=Streptantibioticus silvisoli TaxID=2705255 RepID=A0ABT6W511_9ACTN|nr:hypothetical protein [Streptantibioticus silvisoli]MDI5965821.1 hypothetical protein [Streptantibioticus silvisoli]
MIRLDLSITSNILGETTLRADRIRRDTLTQLALALRGDHATDVQNALDALIDAVASPDDAEGAEIDALVDDIEAEADMGPAEMRLSRTDLGQLLRQGSEVYHPAARPLAVVDGGVAA